MDKRKMSSKKPDFRPIAGELTATAALKQIHDSLIPLQWLASKNGFKRISLLLEEAIKESAKK